MFDIGNRQVLNSRIMSFLLEYRFSVKIGEINYSLFLTSRIIFSLIMSKASLWFFSCNDNLVYFSVSVFCSLRSLQLGI